MEEEAEVECCVCLQAFDDDGEHVPRVQGCGHTLCHGCIEHLAQLQTQTEHQRQWSLLRCPECSYITGLVTPASLPKNIELLRLISRRPPQSLRICLRNAKVGLAQHGRMVLSHLLTRLPASNFSRTWVSDDERLVLGELGDQGEHYSVSLLLLHTGDSASKEAMYLWQCLSRDCREEVMHLSRLAPMCHSVCSVLGMWLSEDNKLYLVNKVPSQNSTLGIADFLSEKRLQGERALLSSLIEICEILVQLHAQGTTLGVFGTEMFQVNEFGHIVLHWNGVIHLRDIMHLHVSTGMELQAWQYTSPEMLLALSGKRESFVGETADVWSFSCFLLRMLLDLPSRHLSFMQAYEEIVDSDKYLQPEHAETPLTKFLLQCLIRQADQRPTMDQVWLDLKRMYREEELYTVSQTECKRRVWCVGLHGLVPGAEEPHQEEPEPSSLEEATVRRLEGHSDCVSCLAICGTTLLSASFDKTVRAWSLETGTLKWCWEGQHSQRILALAADEASQVCFTGDYGGTVCAWKVSEPFDEKPIAKWQEHTDWRFTGVSALAVSADGALYSGSGDKTVKAWCTKGYTLLTTLQGHRALVSALAVDGGLLYSGSWDGSVRIWLRSDHSPMAVLGGSGSVAVRALAVLPGSGVVMSSHDTGCVQVWKNGECSCCTKVHDGVVSSLARMGGACLVTSGWDNSVKVWRVKGDTIEEEAIQCMSFDSPVMSSICGTRKLYVAVGTTINVYSFGQD